jgi:predicted nucleic acid-binding protein
MSNLFLDSSALAKRYLPEVGTPWIRQQLTSANSIIVSRLASVEVMSAVSRRWREGSISLDVVTGISRLLNKHFQEQYIVVDVNHQLTHSAIQLLTQHPLRAYDALQLASAKVVSQKLTTNGLSPLTFLCADARLLEIARNEGLQIDDPNSYV